MNTLKGLLLLLIVGFSNLGADLSCDWVDIPTRGYMEILGIDEQDAAGLTILVQAYHAMDKSSLQALPHRIEALYDISAYLDGLGGMLKHACRMSTINLLNKAVVSKREYLKQLLEIPSDDAIKAYHLDFSALTDGQYEPIALRNNRSYSLKMKEYWGEFWLETVDPCHRRLANYYQFWLDTNPKTLGYQAFFLWLDAQPLPKSIPSVANYSDTQLEQRRAVLADGYLSNALTLERLDMEDGQRAYIVIDLAKDIYIQKWTDGFYHNSLSRGKPVLGAGAIHIENGVITRYGFESGHYLPSIQQSFQSLSILREKGVRFSDPFELIYFENRNKYKVSVSLSCLADYQDFDEAIHDLAKRELASTNEF